MSEPLSPTQPDASSYAILLAVTELRGVVRAALAVQATHATTIERYGRLLDEHGNRLTAVEVARAGDNDHEQRNVSNRAVFWTASAGLTAIIGLVITLFVATHGG